MARRYGRLPSEIAQLGYGEFAFNLAVMQAGERGEIMDIKTALEDAGQDAFGIGLIVRLLVHLGRR